MLGRQLSIAPHWLKWRGPASDLRSACHLFANHQLLGQADALSLIRIEGVFNIDDLHRNAVKPSTIPTPDRWSRCVVLSIKKLMTKVPYIALLAASVDGIRRLLPHNP